MPTLAFWISKLREKRKYFWCAKKKKRVLATKTFLGTSDNCCEIRQLVSLSEQRMIFYRIFGLAAVCVPYGCIGVHPAGDDLVLVFFFYFIIYQFSFCVCVCFDAKEKCPAAGGEQNDPPVKPSQPWQIFAPSTRGTTTNVWRDEHALGTCIYISYTDGGLLHSPPQEKARRKIRSRRSKCFAHTWYLQSSKFHHLSRPFNSAADSFCNRPQPCAILFSMGSSRAFFFKFFFTFSRNAPI